MQVTQLTFVDKNTKENSSGWELKFLCCKSPYLDELSAFTVSAMMSTYTEVGVPC